MLLMAASAALALWTSADGERPARAMSDDMVLLYDVPNEPDADWVLPPPPEPSLDEPADVSADDVQDTGGLRDTGVWGAEPAPEAVDTGDAGSEAPADEQDGTDGSVGGSNASDEGTRVGRPGPASGSGPGASAVAETPSLGGSQQGDAAERVWDLPMRNRLRGRYPPTLARRNLGDVTCKMAAYIDREGELRDYEVLSCPQGFVNAARVALIESRWERFDAPDDFTWRRVEVDVPFRQ